MPEILTMIQTKKLTPAPAVICMVICFVNKINFFKIIMKFDLNLFPQALLSMVYLYTSDIFALITYVGFATWVSIVEGITLKCTINLPILYCFNKLTVEHRSVGAVSAGAQIHATQSREADQGQPDIPRALHLGDHLHHRSTHVREPQGDR